LRLFPRENTETVKYFSQIIIQLYEAQNSKENFNLSIIRFCFSPLSFNRKVDYVAIKIDIFVYKPNERLTSIIHALK
jgi:hypothetical protein